MTFGNMTHPTVACLACFWSSSTDNITLEFSLIGHKRGKHSSPDNQHGCLQSYSNLKKI